MRCGSMMVVEGKIVERKEASLRIWLDFLELCADGKDDAHLKVLPWEGATSKILTSFLPSLCAKVCDFHAPSTKV